MTPKVLFVGCDKGAWQMRGRQIANALGARAVSKPQPEDWAWPDVIVLVKRAAEVWWKEAAASGKVVIWDVLDFWKQPDANRWTRDEHLHRIAQVRRECRASVLIGATKAMAHDIGGIYLPHHCRIGLVPTPPRATAQVVAYDGSPRYLGSWAPALERACAELGLQFVINPSSLVHVDVLVAFRDDPWDGWACRTWKSGVKYVNAIASGLPILTQNCAAVGEIGPYCLLVEERWMLADALREAIQLPVRLSAYLHSIERAESFRVEAIVPKYERIIRSVLRSAA